MNKLIIIIVAALLMSGCRQTATETATKTETANDVVQFTPEQLKNAGITTGPVEQRNMQSMLQVSGIIDVPPQNLVSVSFPLGGYLKSTGLLPGEKIRKGEVLAVMEDPSFIQLQQDYLVARARLQYLQKEYERQQQLNNTKASSDKVLEQARAEYDAQKITAGALREKLLLISIDPSHLTDENLSRSVNIYSPIDGYVSGVNVNIGKYVNPADVLFELVNPTDLHLALTVFEKDLPLLRIGQTVTANLTGDPAKSYAAEIILIGKKLDANRSAVVHCHFKQSTETLLPGMYMNAHITVEAQQATALPAEAVVRSGDGQFIFVERSANTFEMVAVKAGIEHDGYVQINVIDTPDMTGKQVITKNAYAALMKLQNKAE